MPFSFFPDSTGTVNGSAGYTCLPMGTALTYCNRRAAAPIPYTHRQLENCRKIGLSVTANLLELPRYLLCTAIEKSFP
jgi:hypothetical protein